MCKLTQGRSSRFEGAHVSVCCAIIGAQYPACLACSLPVVHVLSAAFLELCVCIVQVAGQQSGVNVVDKAQSAVNTVKIINALNEISDILKVLLSATLLLICPLHSVLASCQQDASTCTRRTLFREGVFKQMLLNIPA